jgi:hypothetical protein
MFSFSVNIIYSPKLDKYYVDYTADMGKWLVEQNSASSRFTAIASDWEFKFCEVYTSPGTSAGKRKTNQNKKSIKDFEWLISSPTCFRSDNLH